MLLVTGITGHSGSYFLDELVKNGYDGRIRCVVRATSDTSKLDNCGLEIEKVIGDLGNHDFIKDVMRGVKVVMHIYNIHHSVAVLEAAIAEHVNRVIMVHTTGIFSKFKSASEEYQIIERRVQAIAAA
ncbi:MAG TPA: NAD(P)H-binding protein, partial [Clostridiaceae bacterium]|nr:NAD(P)H-binding protein [Clostridiaceae bacterium]